MWVPLLKQRSRKKGALIIKGLLRNLGIDYLMVIYTVVFQGPYSTYLSFNAQLRLRIVRLKSQVESRLMGIFGLVGTIRALIITHTFFLGGVRIIIIIIV